MIDFHNHIIPNVDDGSNSIEMSLSMLQKAAQTGITKVVTTTHYNHPYMKERFPDFKKINIKLDELRKEMLKNNLNIEIHSSAEVYFNESVLKFIDNKNIIIGDRYILIEFDFNFLPKNYEKILYKLQLLGKTPIIAHPERYKFVQRDYTILKDWIDKEFIIQISSGSLLKHFGNKSYELAKKIAYKGNFHLIGSDAHNDRKRNFCLKDSIEHLKKFNKANYYEMIEKNNNNLLEGKNLSLMPEIKDKNNFIFRLKRLVNI